MIDRPRRDFIGDAITGYLKQFRKGGAPSQEEFVANHEPHIRKLLAGELEDAMAIEIVLRRPQSQMTNLSDGQVLGEFVLHRELGRGARGVVYLAEQKSLGRSVAVKCLHPTFLSSEEDVKRFEREAELIAKLRHPNIVNVISTGRDNGISYYAMEFVDGQSLRDLIEENATLVGERRSLTPGRAARIIAAVAEALECAHRAGIVHRDVKPDNILLSSDDVVFIADFGIAKSESEGATLTKTGIILGTPQYMSPEQIRGEQGFVPSGDIFSLGSVLYETLTSRRPFDGESQDQTLANIKTAQPTPLRRIDHRIPGDLAIIVNKAIEKDAKNRFQSAGEFAEDLNRFIRHEAIVARAPTRLARSCRWAVRNRIAIGILIGLLLSLCALSWWDESRRSREAVDSNLAQLRVVDGDAWSRWRDGTWRGAELRELATAHAALMNLEPNSQELLPEPKATFERMKRKFEELESNLSEKMQIHGEELENVGPGENQLWYATQIEFLDRMRTSIFGLSSPGQRLYPTISITLGEKSRAIVAGGTVVVQTLNPYDGTVSSPRNLGPLPVENQFIEPGLHRFTIRYVGGATSEYERYLSPSIQHLQLELEWPRGSTLTAKMIHIKGGHLNVPKGENGMCSLEGVSVPIQPFWIDECEVSNGDYEVFLSETGTKPPLFWSARRTSDDIPNWGVLPATGMTWADAQSFAEWRGTRLVTHAEWEFAALGDPVRLHPWASNQTPGEVSANIFGQQRRRGGNLRSDFLQYVASANPVRSSENARTQEGLFHMYGNVEEMTGSLWVGTAKDRVHGKFKFLQPMRAVHMGHAWDAAAGEYQFTIMNHSFLEGGYGSKKSWRGFRCAKSAN